MRKWSKRVHEKCILGKYIFCGRAALPLFMCIEEIKCERWFREIASNQIRKNYGSRYGTIGPTKHINMPAEIYQYRQFECMLREQCTKWHSNQIHSHIIQNSFHLSTRTSKNHFFVVLCFSLALSLFIHTNTFCTHFVTRTTNATMKMHQTHHKHY